MTTTTFQSIAPSIYVPVTTGTRPGLFGRFLAWCEAQQPHRILWIGIALAAHGCVLTPMVMMCVLLAGANLSLVIVTISAMGLALVTNLAALPTRITIPVFFLSILIDLAVVAISLVSGMHLSNAF